MSHWTFSSRSFRLSATVLFTVMLSSLSYTHAQNAVVRGVVLDSEFGHALGGANVQFLGEKDTGTASGVDGVFELEIPPGTYQLVVTFIGYLPFEETISLSVGVVRRLTIRLTSTEIQINPITVTASRRPEKLLDAPAAITVVGPRQLETKTALTAAQHLKMVPGVDLIKTGLVSSRVVIRGFNDNLASSLLTLVDNRIARAPSVRLTALQLIPLTNGDTEQIEIVSGPASALYGPNAANGVVHIITRSPFDSRGTRVSLAGGEQNVMLGSLRHAGVYKNWIGYKVSLQYYKGSDFEFVDPVEVEARQAAISIGASPDTLRIGARKFDVKNVGINGRLDFRFSPDLSLILTGGMTRGDNIEVTPTGAAQVFNARISYAQARLKYRNLFVQAYGNFLNSGDSYFLRTGEVFKDKSKLFVLQAQHNADVGDRQRFTYGADLFFTIPEGEGTVTGRYENRDEIVEIGGYLQSETDITANMTLIGAARLDYHDRLDKWTFSPRAALVFKPKPAHSIRLTYNIAFRTPTAQQLFADVLGQADLFQLGQLSSTLGFAPTTDLRVQGLFTGFHFGTSAAGRALYRSPFAPLAGLNVSDFIELGDPAVTRVMWDVVRLAAVEGLADNLVQTGLLQSEQADDVSQAINAVLPDVISGVGNILKLLDLDSQQFQEVNGAQDFNRLKVTNTRTIELGYKGIIQRFIVLGIDLYHSNIRNFLGPFEVGTPNVFLDPGSLNMALIESLETAFDQPQNAAARNALLPLDGIPLIGNGDGSAARELAGLISTGIASAIPFGTVSPEEAFDATAIILMRRNFGNISLYGADISVNLFFSRRLQVNGTYSYVSDNFFENVDGVEDISLNAPRHKAGGSVRYTSKNGHYGFQAGMRFVDGFPVKSDIYIGRVERFSVFDASFNYRVPFSADTNVNLTIQNLTNNKHREFVFVPEIGRLAMLRLTHEF